MSDQPPEGRHWGRYAELGQVGIEMVAPIVLGLLLDHYLGWTPWLTVVGAVAGFGGGMYRLLSLLQKWGRQDQSDGPSRGSS